jgi:hypothetical protein
MITKAEKILKELNLDYKQIVKDRAWSISPLDFMCDIKIVLVRKTSELITKPEYSMFIWKDKSIQKECEFNVVGNITDIYSYLYNFDKNNLQLKKLIINELT